MGATVAGATVGWLVVMFVPPVYRAEALVVIDPRASPASSAVDNAPPAERDSLAIDTQVALLASRGLASEVLARLQAERGGEGMEPLPEAADRLLAALEVERQGKSRVVAVRVRDRDPVRAARIANLLVETWLVAQLAGKFSNVSRTSGWFAEKLRALERQVAQAEAKLVAFREENAHLFDTALAHANDRLADLEREHLLARANRQALETRLQHLRRRTEEGSEAVALGLSTPLLAALETAEADLLRRESELRGLYGAKHPQVAEVEREKQELRRRIVEERRSILARLDAELAEARTRESALAAELERIRRIAAEARQAELEKRRLEREVELDRKLYESFAGRFEATSDAETVEQPDARVLAEAQPPTTPFFPKPQIVLPLATATGLGFGLLGLVLRERLDRRLATARDIAFELGLPTLSLIPELPRRRASKLPPHWQVAEHPRSRLAEAVRELLARLTDGQTGSRVLLVTSALPDEGKSSLVLALAGLAALEGLRVVVVDGDLRKPSLAGRLASPHGPGFAEVLAGERSLEEVVRREDRTGFVFLPGSARHLWPARLLAGTRLRDLFVRLRATADLVLVDSAPLAAVADGQLLAREADGILFVVRARWVPGPVARDALESLGSARARVLGAVLTRVRVPTQARYGDGAGGRLARRLSVYYAD